jgi:hypothetical protein
MDLKTSAIIGERQRIEEDVQRPFTREQSSLETLRSCGLHRRTSALLPCTIRGPACHARQLSLGCLGQPPSIHYRRLPQFLSHNLQLCLRSLSGSRGIPECFVNSNLCSGQSWTSFELQIKVHFPNRRIPGSVFVTGLQVLGSGARSMKIPSPRFKNRYRPEGGS